MEQLPKRTYFEAHAEELLRNAGLTKAKFSERMGVARQNVQKVFGTKNVFTLLKAAEILGVSLDTLIAGEKTNSPAAINGFIEINGETYKIKDKNDIEDLMSKV